MLTYEIEKGIDKILRNPENWKWFTFDVHDDVDVYTAGFIAGYWGGLDNPYFYTTPEYHAFDAGECDGREWRFYVDHSRPDYEDQ